MQRLALISSVAVLLLVPQVLSQVKPVVLVGCFNAQFYPPAFCPNYTQVLLDLARDSVKESYGPEIEVKSVSDWFFLLDAIALPNVIGCMISLREGLWQLSEMRQEEFIDSFEDGLGLVGIHAVGYSPFMGRVSLEVFPLNGTKIAPGKVHRNKVITSRHTHRKYIDHPITAQSPEEMEIPDAGLIHMNPLPEEGWWTPEEGEITVLYVSPSAVKGKEVPSIVLYERGSSRSVTFAGLRHIDATGRYETDLLWYNHSMGLPEVGQLLADSLVYVLEPLASKDPLDLRMEESRNYLKEKLNALREKDEMAEKALDEQRNRSIANTIVVFALSAAAVLVVGYTGFVKKF